MNRQEYDALERLNFSKLKHMDRSPAHYRYRLDHPEADTDARKMGRAIHVAAFEPVVFARRYTVWDGGTRRGKAWDQFRTDNADKEILTEKEAGAVEEIAASVRADRHAVPYLSGGRGEQTLQWVYEQPASEGFPAQRFECKGRLDWITPTAIVDLKSARSSAPDAFARDAVKYGYLTQAAWYADGYALATGHRLPFVIVAVETAAPYVVSVFTIPDRYLQMGRENYRALLNRLDWCQRENVWPGYLEAVADLELPPWADPDAEGDLSGLGLVFGEEEEAA